MKISDIPLLKNNPYILPTPPFLRGKSDVHLFAKILETQPPKGAGVPNMLWAFTGQGIPITFLNSSFKALFPLFIYDFKR